MESNSKVYIAKIGKTIGLKGELKLHIDTDFTEQFKKNATFIIQNNSEIKIEYYNPKKKSIKFLGVDNIDEAKKLTNQKLYTTIQQTRQNCKLEDGEYFWFDIIGLKVFQDNICLGVVSDIERLLITDYLKIITDKYFVSQNLPKEFLLPYIKDKFIMDIDMKNKIIKVDNAIDILKSS